MRVWPDGFFFQPHLKFNLFFSGLINNNFTFADIIFVHKLFLQAGKLFRLRRPDEWNSYNILLFPYFDISELILIYILSYFAERILINWYDLLQIKFKQ